MALIINKLFSSRKKSFNKHQDACERTFTFSQDQVRVVLFRECDFRGRKLLFDSQSVQKIPLSVFGGKAPIVVPGTPSASPQMSKNEVFVEVSNGYGYQYSRPSSDIVQLGEMVFGSVAMSFRGTSLKIHSFSNPAKLMCTQVFPSPRPRGRQSVVSQNFDHLRSNSSVHSFEKSLKLDYSSASSTTSFNEHTSLCSTDFDIKMSGSVPLDVPASNESMTCAKLAPSLEGDSGFCGEQSYSSVSVSSGPPSMSLWDSRFDHGSTHGGFSCGSLYKRWLRSASTSLDYPACSDNSLSAVHSSASADECITRPHHRWSKLGLAVIIRFDNGQEVDLERFLLEHSALIEAMVSRARAGAESAYQKSGSFPSQMYEVYKETSEWLCDLISGPAIGVYLWHALGAKNRLSNLISETKSESALSDRTKSGIFSGSLLEIDGKKLEQNVRRSLFGPLTSECARVFPNLNDASLHADRFVKELCELLEAVDTKHTNFFISTLLTAVLTHHLGWVSTVLPPSQTDRDTLSKLNSPCNPLWGQLSDLYGAVGSPTKVAHTIICGNTKPDIISKILYTLTYFIRCSVVERNRLFRFEPDSENIAADNIFLSGSKLNKTKKSDKFVEELEMFPLKNEHINNKNEIINENKSIGLTRTKHPLLDKVTSLGFSAANIQTNNNEEKLVFLPKSKTSTANLSKLVETASTNNFESDKENVTSLSSANIQTNINQEKLVFLPKSKTSTTNLSELVETTSSEPNCESDKENVTSLGFSNIQNNEEKLPKHLVNLDEASNEIRKVFLPKSKASTTNLSKLVETTSSEPSESDKENVIFVLGDDEALIGLKKQTSEIKNLNIPSCSSERPKDLKLNQVFNYSSDDSSPELENKSKNVLKFLPGTSTQSRESKIVMTRSSVIDLESEIEEKNEIRINRSQSVPPSDKSQRKCSKTGCKKKYSGVKFDFKQYPQIVTNYMKSKNLELSQSPFSEKSFKLNRSFSASFYDCSKIDFPSCDCEPSPETLQTPSNASELEFSSEIEKSETQKVREKAERKFRETKRFQADFDHPLQGGIAEENNAIFEHDIDTYEGRKVCKEANKMNFVELPMPRIKTQTSTSEKSFVGYTQTLLRGVGDKYLSDMVLQGTSSSPKSWEHILRRDLTLASRKPLLDQPVQEAVAIIANTDTWEVQLVSSHTYIVEKGSTGIRVGMSQLVANMLESLLHMWKLRIPSEYCLMHIESHLRELCIRSQAVAQLLLTTEFCNMEFLTSTMQLEVNDVPLLMAVASTHSPQVTQKYGLSFQ